MERFRLFWILGSRVPEAAYRLAVQDERDMDFHGSLHLRLPSNDFTIGIECRDPAQSAKDTAQKSLDEAILRVG